MKHETMKKRKIALKSFGIGVGGIFVLYFVWSLSQISLDIHHISILQEEEDSHNHHHDHDHHEGAKRLETSKENKHSESASNSMEMEDDPMEMIAKDLKSLEFISIYKNRTVKDFQLAEGGKPIITLLVTQSRSGSTFTGGILKQHPGSLFFNDPIRTLVKESINCRIKEESNITGILRDMFRCKLNCFLMNNGTGSSFSSAAYEPLIDLLATSNDLFEKCIVQGKWVCSDLSVVENLCSQFPIQVIRLKSGMPLSSVTEVLQDDKLNIRVLYLVRDPRGTMRSRNDKEFLPGFPPTRKDMAHPFLCENLALDFETASKLIVQHPKKFMVVRFEELALDPWRISRKIYKFLDLKFTSQLESFLRNHTIVNRGNALSTYRDSKNIPFKWVKEASKNSQNFQKVVQTVQEACKDPIQLWGYKYVNSSEELSQPDFNPVATSKWSLSS